MRIKRLFRWLAEQYADEIERGQRRVTVDAARFGGMATFDPAEIQLLERMRLGKVHPESGSPPEATSTRSRG